MEFNSKGREIAARDDDDGNQGSIFLPEVLVIEILLRLHIRPLFRFKLVSKRWNSIISDPKFADCYLQLASSPSKSPSQWHLWGILDPVVANPPVCQQWHKLGDSNKPVISTFHETDNAPPSLYSPVDKSYFPYEDRIMASSGGLILSVSRNQNYCSSEGVIRLEEDIRVFNPLTKQSAKLPLLWCRFGSYFSLKFGLATRRPVQPAGGDHPAYLTYKVVVIQNTIPNWRVGDHRDVEIYTFCWDIGRWTQKRMINCPEVAFRCCKEESFTCKGILHWFDWSTRSVITYDPYNSPDRFGRIQLPTGSGETLENSGMNLIHFGHEDVLMFGDIEYYYCDDHSRRLRVWKLLDHAKGEWRRLEQTCPISQFVEDELLRGLRKLVAPDPCNSELFCLIIEDTHRMMKAVDLETLEEVFVDPSKVSQASFKCLKDRFLLIALCPWASPFYRQDRSNSSSEVRFLAKIPDQCLLSFNQ